MGKIIQALIALLTAIVPMSSAYAAESVISVSPSSLCNDAEPVFASHGRYVPVSDRINGREIFRIENGSKVSVCGAPIKGWYRVGFGVGDTSDDLHEFTGWVRAEFVH
jgi:hypothetical protein